MLINVERHGREDLGIGLNFSRTVGWFPSIAPVLLEVPADAPSSEVLNAVRQQWQALPSRGVTYGLLRYLGEDAVRHQLDQLPEAEVFFCYHGRRAGRKTSPQRGPQPGMGPLQSRQGSRRHLIELNAVIQQDELQTRWSFSSNVHERATIDGLIREFLAALRATFASGRSRGPGSLQAADFPEAKLDDKQLACAVDPT